MSKKSSKVQNKAIQTDLLLLCDNFAEFNDYCAFLCDALACLVAQEDGLDNSTVQGVGRFSMLIKHKAQKLKDDLKKIHEQAYNQ